MNRVAMLFALSPFERAGSAAGRGSGARRRGRGARREPSGRRAATDVRTRARGFAGPTLGRARAVVAAPPARTRRAGRRTDPREPAASHRRARPARDQRHRLRRRVSSGIVRRLDATSVLAPSQRRLADDLARTALGSGSRVILRIDGEDVDARLGVAQALAEELRRRVLVVRARRCRRPAPTSRRPRGSSTARRCCRTACR